MRHTSIPILEQPCEFINITPINPLISKCEIKVCYVSDDPNRNRSIITKDVAREMANSLPGSPIVGYYNEAKGDFEEHNRIIDISGGKIKIKDTTRPYGFVDLGAKVWFQKFLDDGVTEREYLMTEGYLWTGQYPEAQRIIDQGNNQSMELSDKFLDATWTKDINGKPKFFIINEAIIAKLCILGDDQEPCFEGSTITQPTFQFSFDDDFKNQLFSMMNELKELIKEGGAPVFTTFAVEIGDALWGALYTYLETKFPRDLKNGECEDCYRCSKYLIDSVWEEGTQKFAILKERANNKLYRLDFTWTEAGFASEGSIIEVEKSYVPVTSEEPTFALDAVEAFEAERYKVEDNSGKTDNSKIDNPVEGENNFAKKDKEKEEGKPAEGKKSEDGGDEEKCPKCGKPKSECTCEDDEEYKKKKTRCSLEEIPEYIELQNKYSALETDFNELKITNEKLESQVADLVAFKAEIDRKEKQAMINSFYMLSDEDKKDVVDNIDTYSLDEIEAKLSIICVRNKVSFNLEDNNKTQDPTTYSLNGGGEADYTPAWIKSLQSVAKDIK